MINPEKRKAIFSLHEEGMGAREISHRLKISRNTVRTIIKQKGIVPCSARADKCKVDPELLNRLYNECEGWVQRIYEKLADEGVQIGYSTLTRMIQELGYGCQSNRERCDRVPDEPGAEMQQDTSLYTFEIGGKQTRVVGSILYLRYSKMRYLKFYRSFNRFKMKCFFYDALTSFGYTARVCIIDNTNLARLRGVGKNAIIVPEMEQFARQFGFTYTCHEIGEPNRKAGNERSFYIVETNFFPGRKFENMEDLNNQAFNWATVKMANRPVSKTGLIPVKAFEHEQSYLIKLPPFIEPPYLLFKRSTDQYGYAAVDGNYYWIPGTKREEVTILQYSQSLKIYLRRELLAEYQLPADEIKNQLFSLEGKPKTKYKTHDRKKPTKEEEEKLRKAGEEINTYLDFALKSNDINGKKRHRFIRELFSLHQKIALPLFVTTIKRALKYRITDMNTIERIAILQMTNGNYEIPDAEISNQLQNRESYLEGRLCEDVDLSIYDKMCEEEEDKNG